ncbi:hypothetical protein [Labrenzia sp. R5_0]|uniref:hypothetical protein n=1 Tax=Labrenzia sp. R5_0 TaxID=2821108 RepID=UPI001ADB0DDB|nr:hypothetical protein [Labrenzia sp. R5_0]MBO9461168.1 hypothetical protein [Labrenzia sp. R5_0]
MNSNEFNNQLDNLNRTAKLFLDQQEATSFEESHQKLRQYRLHAEYRANSAANQIGLLTLINTASRFALGGVTVSGDLNVPMQVPYPRFQTLGEAAIALGAAPAEPDMLIPTVIFGEGKKEDPERMIRAIATGWSGGIAPVSASLPNATRPAIAPAAILSGAMAAAEGFALLSGNEPIAGRRIAGMSLWEPERIHNWFSDDVVGPDLIALPSDFWLLGLGHLGQAFLWTILMSPYQNPEDVHVLLQDFDDITGSTISTSILSSADMVGVRKTRAMARILDDAGFRTTVLERRFDGNFKRLPDDPAVLICCVDNKKARKVMERPGFPLILEAGIGQTKDDFRSLRFHSFPAKRRAHDLWRDERQKSGEITNRYTELSSQGLDPCGLARLANTAVGAPFVGAVAGPVIFSQLLRALHGRSIHAAIDLDLKTVTSRRMIPKPSENSMRLGFVRPVTHAELGIQPMLS